MVENGESVDKEVYSPINISTFGESKDNSINASMSCGVGRKLLSLVKEIITLKSIVTGLLPIAVTIPSNTSTSTPNANENWSRTIASMCMRATSAARAYCASLGSVESVSIYVSRKGDA